MGYRGAPSGGRRWGIGAHHQGGGDGVLGHTIRGEVMGYRGAPSGGR